MGTSVSPCLTGLLGNANQTRYEMGCLSQREDDRYFLEDLTGRGLHSSTSRLNVSAFCGIGGAFVGCLGGV